ncbi:MAG TPA: bis(5'-nucleosyl)-tetraphosphatase (symmetrical) YqeK [Rectinemataceae bacterium]|nr:bis(5'-nucleosyl)-tetraphosphatase (symmetrical) YqeK [Rectinemataceae bacterium]
MAYAELISKLMLLVDERLSPSRAAHSRAVADLAAELCARQGLDPDRGRAAGLAHDLCKEFPPDDQRKLAADYPGISKGSALMAEKILHGPAAAVLLGRDYGVDDDELLEAVALHTVGKPGMNGLCLILYCADKLDPSRRQGDPALVDRCLGLPPREMLLLVVSASISRLEATGHAIAPETLVLYTSLQQSVPAP